jgi:hypothetical protein
MTYVVILMSAYGFSLLARSWAVKMMQIIVAFVLE